MSLNRAIVMLVLLAAVCFGQGGSATIEGRVTDASGAVIPNAPVTITNVATDVVRRTQSNAEGLYVAPFLPSGTYSVSVEQKGFATVERTGIRLRVDDKLTVDFALAVGGASTRVEVTGSSPLVNEVNAALGMVIDDRRISDLPLDGREPFSLAGLSPGVIPVPATANIHQGGTLPGINGTSNGTSAALVDGAPDSTNVVGGQNMQLVYTPSVDTVAEFKVETNALSAEYGRYNGGVISLVTKSGTNQPHGTAYDFLRNSYMDANNFFNNRNHIPLTSLKRNQFGATLGGPVVIPKLYHGQNRTFFFVDYEGFRQSTAASANFTVPSALQRTGDFSKTTTGGQLVTIYDPLNLQTVNGVETRAAFPGNVIPQNRLNPVALNLQKYFPLPNNVSLTNNYEVAASLENTDDTGGVRIDHNFSDRHRIFGRFSIQYPGTGAANYYGNIGNYGAPPLVQRRYHDSVQDTISLSPTLIVNINYGFLHQYGARIAWSNGFDSSSTPGVRKLSIFSGL